MSKRLLTLLLAGMVSLGGLALAQDPAGKEEPPVRLKKKKPRGDDKPMVDPDKPDEKKKDDKKDEKEEKKAEPREPEPVMPEEEEKEILQRVVTNVQKVGDRLAKNDLGEATQQTQRDILKDLESLIHSSEVPLEQAQGQGLKKDEKLGEQQNAEKNAQRGQGVGLKRVKVPRMMKGKGEGGNGQKQAGQQRTGTGKPGEDKRIARGDKDGKEGDKPGGKNGKGGNGGGGGDKEDRRVPNRAADQYKDVWGHLPQTLRAQMDAYSNPQPFMPKYDNLIKQYYRTISEQGRRKGE
ncbi:MAG: hypothetical protein ACYC3I_04030 [Gemmataceae bacterium]